MNGFLTSELQTYAEELGVYLSYSFGNEVRLDYGTGHESFLAIFLCCLNKLDIVHTHELRGLILSSFVEYMKTVRKLQTIYLLEPAGSHGVWGLDDYQCLVFLWGAAQVIVLVLVLLYIYCLFQLKGHPDITPSCIHDDAIMREFGKEYLYLDGIRY